MASNKIREYCITLPETLSDVVASECDAAGYTCDNEYLNDKVIELIQGWRRDKEEEVNFF